MLLTWATESQGIRSHMSPNDEIMEELCCLLRMFHVTVSPYAKARCIMSPRTGTHFRSITETPWLVEEYATYAFEILHRHQSHTAQTLNFILLPNARLTVRTLLDDACAGKWLWTLRSDVEILLNWAEREACETRILERFVSGCDEDSPLSVPPPQEICPSWMPVGLQTGVVLPF